MNYNHLTKSQILSISNLVKPTIFYFCKKNKVFLEKDEVDTIISYITYRALSSSTYNPDKPFSPWIRAIAKNYLFDYFETRYKRIKKFTPILLAKTSGNVYEPNYSKDECHRESLADEQVSSETNLRVIANALDSLGPVGQAFWLQFIGYNSQEIAEHLGKTNGAIRTKMSYARKVLARNPELISLCKEFGIKISA